MVDRLKPNSVGLLGVVFMAVATAAPITAMTGNVPVAVAFGNGIGAPAGYIFATVVLTIFSIGFVAMARRITSAGAFYGFISHGLGRVIGLASGLLAVLAYIVFEASIVGIFAYFADTTINAQLGVDLPWQVYAGIMLAVTAILSYFDIHLAARVLGVFLVAEIAVLAVMAFGVLLQGGGPDGIPASPLDPAAAFGGTAAGFGLFMAFWSWVGFESTAMYGEESRNPKKIIPIATMVAVIGIGLFYVFVSWMAIAGNGLAGSVQIATANPLGLFFAPTEQAVGHWAVVAFQWLMITGSFACGMAFHQCAARYLYALGREGLIWRRLGRTHPKHGSPFVASFAQTGIAVVIVALFSVAGQDPYLGLYTLMALLGTMAILIVQALCSFAVVGYFWGRRRRGGHWFTTLVAPLAGGAGMITVVWLLFDNADAAAGPAAESTLFTAIPWIVAAVFIGGVAGALYLRKVKPAVYDLLGRIVLEDTRERSVHPVA
ncbi:amino acid transporter [Kibdelosporangium banguiense]|uniref:Amino acid transporter n=1 Tax=Kibdelosporangium banguiense TaxID=1365924 RepID=A0ABS4TU02_9PSEU|nr:APC family permease [Kibdelosporangium banguiense]MBP2327853.1 amino acid transporter [Kibdelosporangium banguiense]